jgi:hypothetical protein
METPIKHRAANDPELSFWAERGIVGWIVVGQVDGFAATEAHDDAFARQRDADGVAKILAASAPAPDATVLSARATQQRSKNDL